MKNMKKKVLLILLTMAMTLSTFSIPVLADENTEEIQMENQDEVLEIVSEDENILVEEQAETTEDCLGITEVDNSGTIEEDCLETTEECPRTREEDCPEITDEEFVIEENIAEEMVAFAGSTSHTPTEQEVYNAIIAMKSSYPEGTVWTNSNGYTWKGGIYTSGGGCAGFAFLLSDAAFGNLPARKVTGFSYEDVRVGDILRIYSNTHSVVVLEKYDDYVVLAEGNYAGTIHWGRIFTKRGVLLADYLLTRYPEETEQDAEEEQIEEPVLPAASITSQPTSLAAELGQTVSFSVEADNATAYQWYYSTDNQTWHSSSATGSATGTLTFKLTTSNQNNVYRCKVTGTDGNTKNSSKAGAVIITEQPATCRVAVGGNASYHVSANNIAAYQWQYSKNNGENWYNSSVTGSDTDTITFKATSTNRTMLYRCKLTNANGITAYSAAAGFGEAEISISRQPSDVTVEIGEKAVFSVEASNVTSYQWQYSKDGKNWYKSTADGNTTETLRFTVNSSNRSNIYRCKLVGADGSIQYTNSASIHVG